MVLYQSQGPKVGHMSCTNQLFRLVRNLTWKEDEVTGKNQKTSSTQSLNRFEYKPDLVRPAAEAWIRLSDPIQGISVFILSAQPLRTEVWNISSVLHSVLVAVE